MTRDQQILSALEGYLRDESLSPKARLTQAIRFLAKHRSNDAALSLIRVSGRAVRSGPFAGMLLSEGVTEGCFTPKLLGCYEQELHEILYGLPERGYEAVLNIGCAEGFYAVGLAQLLPNTTIWAYDTDEAARTKCAAMAMSNGVPDRIKIGGLFSPADFEAFEDRKTLVVCDVEGAELDVLDPGVAPALRRMDVLVEHHTGIDRSIAERITARFKTTHDIEDIHTGGRDPGAYPELVNTDHLTQLLAVWEWRGGPTPWSWMTVKQG